MKKLPDSAVPLLVSLPFGLSSGILSAIAIGGGKFGGVTLVVTSDERVAIALAIVFGVLIVHLAQARFFRINPAEAFFTPVLGAWLLAIGILKLLRTDTLSNILVGELAVLIGGGYAAGYVVIICLAHVAGWFSRK
jgi:hypothetical protein